MVTPVPYFNPNSPSVSTTNFMYPQTGGVSVWGGSEAQYEDIASVAGTFGTWRIKLTTAPGVGKSWTFTFRVNGVDQSLVVVISGTATSGADTTHTVTVAAGDLVSVKCVPAGTPTATGTLYGCFAFTATVSGKSPWYRGSTPAITSGLTRYYPVHDDADVGTTENQQQSVMPAPGTLTALYVSSSADPGGAGQSYTFTLMVNGVASALTCAINTGGTTANDTGNTVNVVAGDTVSWRLVTSASAATARFRVGCCWTPTTSGEAVAFGSSNATLAQNTTSYRQGSTTWSATEADREFLLVACTVKKLYVVCTGIASGQTFQSTVRRNAGSSSITNTITGTATTGNDTTHTDTAVDDDLVSVQGITSATTGTVRAQFGFVLVVGGTAWTQSLSESLAYTDTRSLDGAKALSEALSLTDGRALGGAKSLSDSYSLSDTRSLGVGKSLADSLSLSDARALSAAKALSEALPLSDSRALAIGKVVSELLSLLDGRSLGAGKGFVEALSLSEAIALVVSSATGLPPDKPIVLRAVAALLRGVGLATVPTRAGSESFGAGPHGSGREV